MLRASQASPGVTYIFPLARLALDEHAFCLEVLIPVGTVDTKKWVHENAIFVSVRLIACPACLFISVSRDGDRSLPIPPVAVPLIFTLEPIDATVLDERELEARARTKEEGLLQGGRVLLIVSRGSLYTLALRTSMTFFQVWHTRWARRISLSGRLRIIFSTSSVTSMNVPAATLLESVGLDAMLSRGSSGCDFG